MLNMNAKIPSSQSQRQNLNSNQRTTFQMQYVSTLLFRENKIYGYTNQTKKKINNNSLRHAQYVNLILFF